MSLAKKSFKELVEMTEEVAFRFFAAKKMQIYTKSEMVAEKDDDYLPHLAYLEKVEEAYRSLTEKEKNLINNEFFFQNYRYWWIGLYSKTTFYRFKKQAMLNFLEAIYHV